MICKSVYWKWLKKGLSVLSTKLIIIEDIGLDQKFISKHKKHYNSAEIVFGTSPHTLSQNKFFHILHKDFYETVINDYTDFLDNKLEKAVDKIGDEAFGFDFFEGHIYKPLFFSFFVQNIIRKYPNHCIKFITKRFVTASIVALENRDSGFEIFYRFNAILRSRFFIQIRFMTLSLINLASLLLKLCLFKLQGNYRIIGQQIDIVYVSGAFKYWKKYENDYIDYYYKTSFDELSKTGKVRPICLTTDISISNHLRKHSMFNFISLIESLKHAYGVLLFFFAQCPKFDLELRVSEVFVLRWIFITRSLGCILKKIKPHALFYYDEIYAFGRPINVLAHNLKIEAYGFQHALNSSCHVTYRFFSNFKKYPRAFPTRFFVYGEYSLKLYSNYGYSFEKMIPIGFERIDVSSSTEKFSIKKKKFDTLFIGSGDSFDSYFEKLYRLKESLPLDKIYFRPHPREKFNIEEFSQKFPEAILINTDQVNIDESIAMVDCVIAIASTTLINSIYQNKISVCWLPDKMIDFYDLNYWGAQVVEDLKEINWDQYASSDKILNEIHSTLSIKDYFLNRFTR